MGGWKSVFQELAKSLGASITFDGVARGATLLKVRMALEASKRATIDPDV
jgi:hypothetical protein